MIAELRVHLASPLIFPRTGWLLGDALLHAALARATFPDAADRRDPSVWIDLPLPVDYQDGVPLVSAWLPPADPVPANTERLIKRTDETVIPMGNRKSGPLKGAAESYLAWGLPWVACFISYQPEHRDALMHLVEAIDRFHLALGQHTRRGYGRIADRFIYQHSDRTSAIHDLDGRLLRPMPLRSMTLAPHLARQSLAVVHPPYFAGTPEPAWVPLPLAVTPRHAQKGGR